MTQRASNQENSLPTSNEVTMLPCPFCGNTQATIFEHFKDAHYFYANCIGCDAEGPPALSSKEARDAWNQRGRSSHETSNDDDDREEIAHGDYRYYAPKASDLPWCCICNTRHALGTACPTEKASGEHAHTDECWEPASGCDMGRNEAHAVAEERCEHGIPRRFCTAVHPSENPSICPYGQSDCETTRGGVCQCAMPAEQASDGRD